tara:strand:- start:1574 stop:2758 length:1185 start_codon:yes stop_codon:yes gene_type:complete
MDYSLNIANFRPKKDEVSGESQKFTLAKHYVSVPSKVVSFQDNLQSAISHLSTINHEPRTMYTIQQGDTLSHIAVRVIKKIGEKVTSKAIDQTVRNIALQNDIKDPDLIYSGQKIALPYLKTEPKKTISTSNRQPDNTVQTLPVKEFDNAGNISSVFSEATVRNKSYLASLPGSKRINENDVIENPNFLLEKTLKRAAVKGYIPTEDVLAVKRKIQLMAKSFKFSPDDFAKVALMESDGFNPKASNGRCHGIIQFCDGDDRGAASIGLAHQPEKILELGVVDQLDLVAQYFEDTELKSYSPASIDDLYLTILSPAARFVTNVNEPLPIAGRQARVLHVGGIPDGPITRASIKKGLIQHASEKLGSLPGSELGFIDTRNNSSVAYSSDYLLKSRN